MVGDAYVMEMRELPVLDITGSSLRDGQILSYVVVASLVVSILRNLHLLIIDLTDIRRAYGTG